MRREEFIRISCYASAGIPLFAGMLQSCSGIYYASTRTDHNKIIVPRSEFIFTKKGTTAFRDYVMVRTPGNNFPICLFKIEGSNYVASLLQCTHKGCELNVGGGIYSCPCHGSEFSTKGEVLEGPAIDNLLTYTTSSDEENIYIHVH